MPRFALPLLLIALKCQISSLFFKKKADKLYHTLWPAFFLSSAGHDLSFDFQRLAAMSKYFYQVDKNIY
jgi:hypothetical protein